MIFIFESLFYYSRLCFILDCVVFYQTNILSLLFFLIIYDDFIFKSHISHVCKNETIILALINFKMFEMTNQIKEGGALLFTQKKNVNFQSDYLLKRSTYSESVQFWTQPWHKSCTWRTCMYSWATCFYNISWWNVKMWRASVSG